MKKIGGIRFLLWCLILCVFGIGLVHAQNVNTLTIEPSTYTGRYFCPIDLSIVAHYNGGDGFANCQYVLQFDSLNETLQYLSKGEFFAQTDTAGEIHGNLFYVEERTDITMDTVVCSKIRLTPITTSKSSSQIKFVDKSGNVPTVDTFLHTEDLLNLSYNGADTLTGVSNFVVNYEMCPCTLDSKNPIISNRSHNSNTHYTGTQNIRFLVYDGGGTSRNYWTHGVKNDFSNYNSINVPSGMDNQEGINSGSIKVTVVISGVSQILSGSDLEIVTYTGTLPNIPQYTWDGNYRGYWVTLKPLNFEVEEPIEIIVSVSDNALNNGSVCITDPHTKTETKELNGEVPPQIIFKAPNGSNVNLNVGVELEVSDDRAGIDTGSLIVEILPVMSGGDVIMTGSIYSGSDLDFQLIEGSGVLGGASKYKVTFQPIYEFAVDSDIVLSGYVKDLVGVPAHNEHTFHTRQDCTFYGCVNFVDIFSGSWDDLILPHFTGSLIVVTGTLAPYPYLTGENQDIVMCGPVDESINLNGNIDIYSGEIVINGNLYPYEDLYVTGLDFEYQSGVIIPRY